MINRAKLTIYDLKLKEEEERRNTNGTKRKNEVDKNYKLL